MIRVYPILLLFVLLGSGCGKNGDTAGPNGGQPGNRSAACESPEENFSEEQSRPAEQQVPQDSDAGSDLYPVLVWNKSGGFIDQQGNTVFEIKGAFDSVHRFSDGLALFCYPVSVRSQSASFLFADPDGKTVFKLSRTAMTCGSFHSGRAHIQKQGKHGFIDKKGNAVIPMELDDAGSFSEGLAPARKGNTWGFIDPEGAWAVSARFNWAGGFSEGLAPVKAPGPDGNLRYGFIDRSGKIVIKPVFMQVGAFSEGSFPAWVNGSWGYFDRNGKELIKPRFEEAEPFADDMARVRLNRKYGFINTSGTVAVKPAYIKAGDFAEGLAPVEVQKRKWGYIDRKGNTVIEPKYFFAEPFRKGRARVRFSWREHGYIDKHGTLIWPADRKEP